MKKLFASRKGSDWLSVLLVIIVLFALAIVIPLANNLLSEITDQFEEINDSSADVALQVLQENEVRFPLLWDGLFLTVMFLTFLGTIISCWFIRSHPVFYIVGMFIQAIFIFLALIFGDVISEIYAQDPFTAIVANYPIMSNIASNFPFYMFIFCMMVGIALYAKTGGTQETL